MKHKLSHVVFVVLSLIALFLLSNAQAFDRGGRVKADPISRGFVTTEYRLPSNGLGVIFQQYFSFYKFHKMISGKTYEFTSERPELLSAKDFSVRESGKSVSIRIKKLSTHSTVGDSYLHTLLINDIALYECLFNRFQSKPTTSACDQTDMQLETDDHLQTLIRAGRIEDVSSVIRGSQGLFRIEPVYGFEEGKVYTFEDIRGRDHYFDALNNSKIELHIDAPLILSASDVPKLALGETSFLRNVYTLQGSFEIPDAFKKYRYNIFTDIDRSALGANLPLEVQENRLKLVNRNRSFPINDDLPIVVTTVQCSNYRAPPSGNIQVRGSMHFLEFSETVFTTPIININLDFANRPPCVPANINSVESDNKPESWIGFENDYSLCSKEDHVDLSLSWEKGYPWTFGNGGNLLSSERLLSRLLNTPLEKDVQKQPKCYLAALTRIAQDYHDVDTVKKILNILTTTYENLEWRFGESPKKRYSVDYLKHLRLYIESQNTEAKTNHNLEFQVFSPLAKTLAEHANQRNFVEIGSLLKAMGQGAQDAIPILLQTIETDSSYYQGWVLTQFALHDQAVVRALTLSKDRNVKSLLLDHIKETKDQDSLLYIAKNSTSTHLCIAAFNELISNNRNMTAVGDALFAFANRKFEDSTYKDRIFELLLRINRDQELINLILTNEMFSFHDLPKMGLRAQSAAPKLLSEFKELDNLSYFEVLNRTMKEIHATSSTLRQAYQLAQKSPNQEVKEAATIALSHLNE